jgi:deoxycytidylate deaminase
MRVWRFEVMGYALRKATNKAKEVAKRSPLTSKHGAVIIHPKLGIVSTGFNRPDLTMLHAYMCGRECALHAECDAIRKIPRGLLRGSIVLVVRVTKDRGTARLSKPCKKCMQMMRANHIDRVLYTTDFDTLECIIF